MKVGSVNEQACVALGKQVDKMNNVQGPPTVRTKRSKISGES